MTGVFAVVWLGIVAAPAAEAWPPQPVQWPDIHDDEFRIGGASMIRPGSGYIGSGQIFPVEGIGDVLFFSRRQDLDLFVGGKHTLSTNVYRLPNGYPLRATEDIPRGSHGGRVVDDILGEGFILFPTTSDETLGGLARFTRTLPLVEREKTLAFVRKAKSINCFHLDCLNPPHINEEQFLESIRSKDF